MMSILTQLALGAAGLWGAAICGMRRNHHHTPSIDDEPVLDPERASLPSVCVVVPARDEEHNIGACLDALCRSEYPRLRIRVVDDGSTDGTPEILDALACREPRVEVLGVRELPDGWLGKNHALSCGTSGSGEDWLLFVDADLRVAPSCIARAVAAAERLGADLLTIVPKLETVTFWELAAQTTVAHAILLTLDARAINTRENRRAAAMGPFMLFRRTAYQTIGGHQNVRAEVIEDLRLAEAVKRAGLRLVFARGTDVATLRMYDSLDAIVRGWSKNFHVAVQGKLWLALVTVPWLLFFYGAPWILPIASIVCRDGPGAVAGAFAAAVAVAARIDFERLYGVTAQRPYLAPLGALVVGWILLRSVLLVVRGQPAEWKGRPVGG